MTYKKTWMKLLTDYHLVNNFFQLSTYICLHWSSFMISFHSNIATSNVTRCKHITPNGVSSCYWKSSVKIRSWTYAGYRLWGIFFSCVLNEITSFSSMLQQFWISTHDKWLILGELISCPYAVVKISVPLKEFSLPYVVILCCCYLHLCVLLCALAMLKMPQSF